MENAFEDALDLSDEEIDADMLMTVVLKLLEDVERLTARVELLERRGS